MWHRLADRLNHEYWPWQLIYFPVWPFYLYQAVRQRCAVFFTNVNPAIDMGGFFGESKAAIYALLPEQCYPKTVVVPPNTPVDDVLRVHRAAGIPFPLIVKPDVGERGAGVMRITDEVALVRALANQPHDLLMQALASGSQEFGLMFAKDPASGRTELLSVCGKRFLSVTGDGERTIAELLARSWRGKKQLERLGHLHGDGLQAIPSNGELVTVEPIGNHCRGTTFFDARHLAAPRLLEAVDEIMSGTVGVHYGRFDVRSESEEALSEGRFTVIELNGVSSEPGHIYDPAYSIFRCWAELLRHVRRLGPISLQLQRAGHRPLTLHALVMRCEAYFGWKLGLLRRVAFVFA